MHGMMAALDNFIDCHRLVYGDNPKPKSNIFQGGLLLLAHHMGMILEFKYVLLDWVSLRHNLILCFQFGFKSDFIRNLILCNK